MSDLSAYRQFTAGLMPPASRYRPKSKRRAQAIS